MDIDKIAQGFRLPLRKNEQIIMACDMQEEIALEFQKELDLTAKALSFRADTLFLIIASYNPRQAHEFWDQLRTHPLCKGLRFKGQRISISEVDQLENHHLITKLIKEPLHNTKNPQNTVTIVDCAYAEPNQSEHWIPVFKTLNRIRNRFLKAVGQVILLIDQSMVTTFAQEAPDFWSVRSSFHKLQPTALHARALFSSLSSDPSPTMAQEGDQEQKEQPPSKFEFSNLTTPELQNLIYRLKSQITKAQEAEDNQEWLYAIEKALAATKELYDRNPDKRYKRAYLDLALTKVDCLCRLKGISSLGSYLSNLDEEYQAYLSECENDWIAKLNLAALYQRLHAFNQSLGKLNSEYLDKGLKLLESIVESDGNWTEVLENKAVLLSQYSDLLKDQGDLEKAIEYIIMSIECIKQASQGKDPSLDLMRHKAKSTLRLGRLFFYSSQLLKAKHCFVTAFKLFWELHQLRPDLPGYKGDLADAREAFVNLGLTLKDKDLIQQHLPVIIRSRTELLEQQPQNPRAMSGYSIALELEARAAGMEGDYIKAADLFQKVIQLREKVVQLRPNNKEYLRHLKIAKDNESLCQAKLDF